MLANYEMRQHRRQGAESRSRQVHGGGGLDWNPLMDRCGLDLGYKTERKI